MVAFHEWDVYRSLNPVEIFLSSPCEDDGKRFSTGDVGNKLLDDLDFLKRPLKKIMNNRFYLYCFSREEDSSEIASAIHDANTLINEFKDFSKLNLIQMKSAPSEVNLPSDSGEYFARFQGNFWYVNKKNQSALIEKLDMGDQSMISWPGSVRKLPEKNPDFFQKKVLEAKRKIDEAYKPALKKIKIVFWLLLFTFGLIAPLISVCNRVSYGSWHLFAHKPVQLSMNASINQFETSAHRHS